MTADDFLKIRLAVMAYQAAYRYGVNAMLGTMLVARNRVIKGADWNDTITHLSAEHYEHIDPREPSFQRILQLVDSVYDGSLEYKWTAGALHFGQGDFGGQRGLERVAKIDQLNFYK